MTKALKVSIDDSDIAPMIAIELCLRLVAKQCAVSDRDGAATKILATQWEAEMKEKSNPNLGADLASVYEDPQKMALYLIGCDIEFISEATRANVEAEAQGVLISQLVVKEEEDEEQMALIRETNPEDE